MKGLIEFLYLVLIVGGLFIIWMCWTTISQSIKKRKYSNVRSCIKEQGYRYCGRYSSKGKGWLYSKSISKEIIDSLLLRYKFLPIELDGEYSITDYIAILEFPEWEERYSGIGSYRHGGIRLFHFYAITMKSGEKSFERPLNYYLDNDMAGEMLAPIDLENRDIIESMLSSSIRDSIFKFNNDELVYWLTKMSTR